MTLTVVTGSSGSGKTTFLNDVYKSHHCTYIRQYHNVRPYVTVSKIPHFEPTGLPYWDIYEREGKAATIQVGGTMAGEFTAGLSGGQRKLLLFELIFQRTQSQSDLLIVLDEPFAGMYLVQLLLLSRSLGPRHSLAPLQVSRMTLCPLLSSVSTK
jgi:ABC-type lipoprotein export system ATPase subunit